MDPTATLSDTEWHEAFCSYEKMVYISETVQLTHIERKFMVQVTGSVKPLALNTTIKAMG
jgi:hypothetical protein